MSYQQQPGNWQDPSWPSPHPGYDPAYGQGYPASGAPASPAYGYGPPVAPPTNGLAIASLVVSLAGIITCGWASIVGAILGHVARKQIRQRGEGGDGMALAGIIVGWILFAVAVIGTAVYVALIVWAVRNAPDPAPTF